eukprot:Gb_37562 [translate_table: standard]
MDQFLGFGRRVWFICRVFFGIEERSIRAHRVEFQKRLMLMRERKAALERLPEQVVLSELRKVVDEMQRLSQALTDTEKTVEKYFEPLHKQARLIVEAQLEGEEKIMREMMKATQENMLHAKVAQNREEESSTDSSSHNVEVTVGDKEEKPHDMGK